MKKMLKMLIVCFTPACINVFSVSALLRYEVFCTVAYLSSRLASRLIRISLFRADDSLCCLIRVEAARKQMQPSRSSIACPGLLFLNNLSRQLEWLLYEYALKIPFLCSFSPSLCMSVCRECERTRSCVYAALFRLKQRRCQSELAPLQLNAQRA